jgi:glutaredoxin
MKVPYTEVDLRDHQDLTEKFKQLGHLTAPIVTVGSDLIWSGFKLERLRALGLIDHAENKS